MLADRARMTSGGGFPPGARNLLHFENNLYDEVQGANATYANGAPTFVTDADKKKFGAYSCRTNIGTAISLPNSIIDFGTQDFTISGWLSPVSPSLDRVQLANAWNTDTAAKQIWNLQKIAYNAQYIQVEFGVQIATGGYFYLRSGWSINQYLMNYIKFGRKGGKIFMIINGVDQLDGAPNIGAGVALKANTTEPIRLGATGGASYGGGCHDAYYDEWLFQLGVGDDSLIVPTAPY